MVNYDIRNGVLFGAKYSNDEKILQLPETIHTINCLYIKACIKKIVLPSSLKLIEIDAFSGADSLIEIECLSENFILFNKCLFDKEKNTLYLMERDFASSITLPTTLENISNYAFAYCSKLTGVKIDNNVKYIGSSAFYECSSLLEVNLPNVFNLELKADTFYYCSSLKEITITSNITRIGAGCFSRCENLENVDVRSDKIKVIGVDAFLNCETLKRIDFNDGIEQIQHNAFSGCYALTEISLPATVTTIGRNIFDGDDDLTVITASPQLIKYCKDNGIVYL